MALVDYFLKVEGIEGESHDSKHKNEIEVESFSWGETQARAPGSAVGGMAAGKVQMQDFHFTMKVNKASPKLLLACAAGEHIKKAVLTCRKAGKDQQEYLKYTFSDILVSSFNTGGSGASDILPIDQISLAYSKVEYEYHEQKPDGTLAGAITAGWDLKLNKKV
jgi:type VI secretion system secreted protein Hcp